MQHQFIYKCIVFTKNGDNILLDNSSGMNDLSLPSFVPDTHHVALTKHINDFLNKKYNIRTNVLRAFKQKNNIRIYEIEVIHESELLHHDAIWLDSSMVLSSNELNTFDQEVLKSWFAEPERPSIPWFKEGWREDMEQKVTDDLKKDLRFEQIRSWERSALYKIYSTDENYYLKAVPEVFKHEPLISHYLYQQHPSYVPEIVDVNNKEQWYIMQELKGPLLGQTKNIEFWREAIFRLADIQKESVSRINKLKQKNCPERFVTTIIRDHLKSSLDSLYQTGYLIDFTYNKLMSNIPIILGKCNKIDSTNIPFALEHGDFFGGNIIIHQNEPTIYDWSDSTISHPFLSIIVLLDEVKQIFSIVEADHLLNEYLEYWVEYDSKDNLYNEYQILKSIAPCYYLSLYQTFIFSNFTDNWDKKQIINDYIDEWISVLE